MSSKIKFQIHTFELYKEIKAMRKRFFIFLIVLFFTSSLVYSNSRDASLQNNPTSLSLKGNGVVSAQILMPNSKGKVNDLVKKRRKEKRLQFGEDLIEIGLQTVELGPNTYYTALFIAGPIIVVGSGFLIWGALTKDPTKDDVVKRKN